MDAVAQNDWKKIGRLFRSINFFSAFFQKKLLASM